MIPDIVNGLFELCGAAAIGLSIETVLRERKVRGVSWLTIAFFMFWGLWNLFYYPYLGQVFSFVGGVVLVAANACYIALLVRFRYWPDVENNEVW